MGKITKPTKYYGHKLRKLRNSRGFSQLDLEISADLSMGSVSRMENNHINPTKETLFKIAGVLKLTPEETIDLFCISEILQQNTTWFFPTKVGLMR